MLDARIKPASLSPEEQVFWPAGRLLVWCGHPRCEKILCVLGRVWAADWGFHVVSRVVALKAQDLIDAGHLVDNTLPHRDMLVGALTQVDEDGHDATRQRVRDWWQPVHRPLPPLHFAWAVLLRTDVVETRPNHWERSVPATREDDAAPRNGYRTGIEYDKGRVLFLHASPTLGRGKGEVLRFRDGNRAMLALPMPHARDAEGHAQAFTQCAGPFTLRNILTFTCPRCHRESELHFHQADARISAIDARRKGGAA